MQNKSYFAHVRSDKRGQYETHDLADHLRKVSEESAQFASRFNASDWARLAGLWHDLGKYRPAFQRHIKKSSGYDPDAHISSENSPHTRHASTGAVHAMDKLDKMGLIVAYLIAGHHAGLPDYYDGEASGLSLSTILKNDKPLWKEALGESIPDDILRGIKLAPINIKSPEDLHFLIRMLFSCLIDADFLDTERFMSPEKAPLRHVEKTLTDLLDCFNEDMEKFQATTEKKTELNKLRSEILMICRKKAQDKPGVFTMTVPTGGGKTLSSMAFALEHAVRYKKHRVIYAIPYTSIIEQTADIFRSIFEPLGEVLIEHHSNIEPREPKDEKNWSRLATENWYAPLIITTTVQLFESVYAAKTSRCRKLHNLVNSVIVLDEAHLLPVENLEPIRHAINVLKEQYHVSFLLTTATQTGLMGLQDPFGKKLLQGIENKEMIEDPSPYYKKLRRVCYKIPSDLHKQRSWGDIAEELEQHDTVLAVVSTRKDAKDLFEKIPQDTAYHLSARMCAEHRSRVINEVKEKLEKGEPVRVVSTQLIEAGVDLDFPVVYRALAGLDSIVQAAGRCNREGRMKEGKVVVFVPPTSAPKGALSYAREASVSLLSGSSWGDNALHSPDIFTQYFEKFFARFGDHDTGKVLEKLHKNARCCEIQFRTAAKCFRMIQDGGTVSIFVDYDEHAKKHLDMLRNVHEKKGWVLRKLQRYTVNIYQYEFQKMQGSGRVKEITPGFFAISGGGIYCDKLGLLLEDSQLHPDDTVL